MCMDNNENYTLRLVLDPTVPVTITPGVTIKGKVFLQIHKDTKIHLILVCFQGVIHTKIPLYKAQEEHPFLYDSHYLIKEPETTGSSIILTVGQYEYDFSFKVAKDRWMQCDVPFGPTSSDLKFGHVKDMLPSSIDVSDGDLLGRVSYELLVHVNAKALHEEYLDASCSISKELKFLNTDTKLVDAAERVEGVSEKNVVFDNKKPVLDLNLKQTNGGKKSFVKKFFTKGFKGEKVSVMLIVRKPTQYIETGDYLREDLEISIASADPPSQFVTTTPDGKTISTGLGQLFIDQISIVLTETTHFRSKDDSKENITRHSLLQRRIQQESIDIANFVESDLRDLNGQKLYEYRLPDSLWKLEIRPIPTVSKGFDLCNLDRSHRLDISIKLKPERSSREIRTANVSIPLVVLNKSVKFRYRTPEEMSELDAVVMKQITEQTYFRTPAV